MGEPTQGCKSIWKNSDQQCEEKEKVVVLRNGQDKGVVLLLVGNGKEDKVTSIFCVIMCQFSLTGNTYIVLFYL